MKKGRFSYSPLVVSLTVVTLIMLTVAFSYCCFEKTVSVVSFYDESEVKEAEKEFQLVIETLKKQRNIGEARVALANLKRGKKNWKRDWKSMNPPKELLIERAKICGAKTEPIEGTVTLFPHETEDLFQRAFGSSCYNLEKNMCSVETQGDGNCLFHAICFLLTGEWRNTANGIRLRTDLIEGLVNNWEMFYNRSHFLREFADRTISRSKEEIETLAFGGFALFDPTSSEEEYRSWCEALLFSKRSFLGDMSSMKGWMRWDSLIFLPDIIGRPIFTAQVRNDKTVLIDFKGSKELVEQSIEKSIIISYVNNNHFQSVIHIK